MQFKQFYIQNRHCDVVESLNIPNEEQNVFNIVEIKNERFAIWI